MDTIPDKLTATQFLERAFTVPVVDVRAPKEFLQGHIPGAFSIPLFDDVERAEVGINYKRMGRKTALMKGLEIAGPKLTDFVKQVNKIAVGNEILVHCWRGGMRSEAMAWLFRFSGIKTSVMEGGYRAYRRFIRESFDSGPPIIILGGMTGSGKTEILHHLTVLSEQVLDLEGVANHKGSAFGALGQADQPTNEQFENNLAEQWLSLDPSKPVWLEDECHSIGKVFIPEPLYKRMALSPLVFIEVPVNVRAKRIAIEYGGFDTSTLEDLIIKISRRLGSERSGKAISHLKQGDVSAAILIILEYYDKAYLFDISKKNGNNITRIKLESTSMEEIASEIISTFSSRL